MYMYKEGLDLNNLQGFIWHKTKPTKLDTLSTFEILLLYYYIIILLYYYYKVFMML